ncbi:MAG: hypothetical protein KDI63_09685 [Gammaproteobacteria bacterium]|nr:hypothetical protein [Gammaproteobacteria bacterium]
MWVAKLGGSLAYSARLPDWLGALLGLPVVLVPGGGPFADQVRAAQRRWKFADAVAHRMALMAMEQYGEMICALQAGLEPASSQAAIESILERGDIPVWMALDMVSAAPGIGRSWDITSDSLAAWLAELLGAEGLLLIKSAPIEPGPVSVDRLMETGLVDKGFGRCAPTGGVVWILSDSTAAAGSGGRLLREIVGGAEPPRHAACWVAT